MTRIDARRFLCLLAIPGALLVGSCGGSSSLVLTGQSPIGDGDDISLVVRDFMIDGYQTDEWGYYSYLLIAARSVDPDRAERQRAAADAFMCSYVDARSTEQPREQLAVFYAPVSTQRHGDSAAAFAIDHRLRDSDSGADLLDVYDDYLAADKLLSDPLGQPEVELAIAAYPLTIRTDTTIEERLLTFVDLSNSPPNVVVEVVEALRTTIRHPTGDLERLHSRRNFTALFQEGLEFIGQLVTSAAIAADPRLASRSPCGSTGQ